MDVSPYSADPSALPEMQDAARRAHAVRHVYGAGACGEAVWVAEEAAVEVRLDGAPLAVMMATPADLEDFATGFVVSEGIAAADAVAAVSVRPIRHGMRVDVRLNRPADGPRARLRGRAAPGAERAIEGRSGCGICGVRTAAEALRTLPRVAPVPVPDDAAVARAGQELAAAQALNRLTRSVHAAAWARTDGAVVTVAEDVGRHNAMDKLIGRMAREGLDPAAGFCVLTSRLSVELVQKAAFAGIGVLVAVSAPTALALRRAEAAGVRLMAVARSDGHLDFGDADFGGTRARPVREAAE